MLPPGTSTKAATLLSWELTHYNISIVGLCESWWHSNREFIADKQCFTWSSPEVQAGQQGVAPAIPKHIQTSHFSWHPISDCLFSVHRGQQTVIIAYILTNVSDDTDKDTFLTNYIRPLNFLPMTLLLSTLMPT